MAGSCFGKHFSVSTWGESHGKAIGVVADGCPAGLALCEADIQALLDRRKPGQSRFTTQRSEGDQVEILSGVFEGKTTGTPISMIVWNRDQRSRDYSEIAGCYRPGHAGRRPVLRPGNHRPGGGRSHCRKIFKSPEYFCLRLHPFHRSCGDILRAAGAGGGGA